MMKGEFSMSALMFSIVTVMFVITGLVVFSNNILVTNYPTANVTNYSMLANTEDIEALSSSSYESIQEASETSTLGAIGFAIKGGWDTLKLMFSSLDIFQTMTGEIEEGAMLPFAIPVWFLTLLTITITLIIIFAALRFMGKVNI